MNDYLWHFYHREEQLYTVRHLILLIYYCDYSVRFQLGSDLPRHDGSRKCAIIGQVSVWSLVS